MIEAWFDGACEPVNPGGHAACGALVKVDGRTLLQKGIYIGHGPGLSNNVAEYAGCLQVLKYISQLPGNAVIRGDSKLVIMQLSRKRKSHGGLYRPLYFQALQLADKMRHRLTFEWIPREENAECDRLSKRVLLEKGLEFRIQPHDKDGRSDFRDLMNQLERLRSEKGQR